jgi:hypothetical protein
MSKMIQASQMMTLTMNQSSLNSGLNLNLTNRGKKTCQIILSIQVEMKAASKIIARINQP